MSVECIRFKPKNSGALIGFADLWVPKMGLEIYGCSLYAKDGKKWLNLPSREYTDENGEKKWISIIRFRDKEHMNGFSRLAMKAISEWQIENPETPVQTSEPETQITEDDLPF